MQSSPVLSRLEVRGEKQGVMGKGKCEEVYPSSQLALPHRTPVVQCVRTTGDESARSSLARISTVENDTNDLLLLFASFQNL